MKILRFIYNLIRRKHKEACALEEEGKLLFAEIDRVVSHAGLRKQAHDFWDKASKFFTRF